MPPAIVVKQFITFHGEAVGSVRYHGVAESAPLSVIRVTSEYAEFTVRSLQAIGIVLVNHVAFDVPFTFSLQNKYAWFQVIW